MSSYYGYGSGANSQPHQHQQQQQSSSAAPYIARPFEPYKNPAPPAPENQVQSNASSQAAAAAAMAAYSAYGYPMAPMPGYGYPPFDPKYYYPPTNITNGYDAALYSAANSMVPSNVQGKPVAPHMANKWQAKAPQQPPPPPPPSAPHPHRHQQQHSFNALVKKQQSFQKRRPPHSGGGGGGTAASAQLLYCDVCKISCAGPQTYKEHLDGQKHKKREQASKAPESEPKNVTTSSKANANSFKCELCIVTCTGRDAYMAHLRGTKHQKTMKLHQKLGKPIPQAESLPADPVHESLNAVTVNTLSLKTSSQSSTVSKYTSPHAIKKFVAGTTLTTVATGGPPAAPKQTEVIESIFSINPKPTIAIHEEKNLAGIIESAPSIQTSFKEPSQEESDSTELKKAEIEVEPIGKEYIETQSEGKLFVFYCKLCDCKFNDPNAKNMHLKGRRHRLAYKKKVDPSLLVHMKPSSMKSENKMDKMAAKRLERPRQPQSDRPIQPLMALSPNAFAKKVNESNEDRQIMIKHSNIYPTDEEIHVIQDIVTNCEKGLKMASDEIAQQDSLKANVKKEATEQAMEIIETKIDESQLYRLLKGVMRVGLLAKGLLLQNDCEVELVVLCAEKPTKKLLQRVHSILSAKFEKLTEAKYAIVIDMPQECILVETPTEPKIRCKINLTSTVYDENGQTIHDQSFEEIKQENIDETNVANSDETELLNKSKCVESLTVLRRAKWFQVGCLFNFKLISVIFQVSCHFTVMTSSST